MKTVGPIYRQIADELKRKIEQGSYQEHDLIPSETELARLYEVSRMTARQAVNELVYDGILYRVKGRGTYVNAKKYEKAIHGLTSFTEDMMQKGFSPSSILISNEKIKAPTAIAKKLGLRESDDVIILKRVRLADEAPLALEIVYLPCKLVSELPEDIANRSLYEYLETELQLMIDYSIQEIEAISITEEIANHLNVLPQNPCLFITLQSYLKNGQAFEYVESYYRADRYKFIQPAYRQHKSNLN